MGGNQQYFFLRALPVSRLGTYVRSPPWVFMDFLNLS